jgi:hypothetical protein
MFDLILAATLKPQHRCSARDARVGKYELSSAELTTKGNPDSDFDSHISSYRTIMENRRYSPTFVSPHLLRLYAALLKSVFAQLRYKLS